MEVVFLKNDIAHQNPIMVTNTIDVAEVVATRETTKTTVVKGTEENIAKREIKEIAAMNEVGKSSVPKENAVMNQVDVNQVVKEMAVLNASIIAVRTTTMIASPGLQLLMTAMSIIISVFKVTTVGLRNKTMNAMPEVAPLRLIDGT